MFDGNDIPDEYKESFRTVSELLRKSVIGNLFVETKYFLNKAPYEKLIRGQVDYILGMRKTIKIWTTEEANKFGVVRSGETTIFHHFSLTIPKEFIDDSGKSSDELLGTSQSKKALFKRGLETISIDTLKLVVDLINQDSLLDGKAHLWKVEKMISLVETYNSLPADKKDNWCWNNFNIDIFGFRNELIGKLCLEIQDDGVEKACISWNKRVDPANYMKAVAPITKKQIEEAKKFVAENGYEDSFTRRCATVEDIQAEDILHINGEDGGANKVSIFDKIKTPNEGVIKLDTDKLKMIDIDKFMSDILPDCSLVELYLQNKEEKNLVTLTTSNNKDSKKIFKWGNNFSWTYSGNLAGISQIKKAVKAAGGFVDAPFRFSIMWNESGQDVVDLDAHATQPDGEEIYYMRHKNYNGQVGSNATSMSGSLDIDMIDPESVGVENIYWTDLEKLNDGEYSLFIINFDGKRNKGPKKAEIFFDGELYQYQINDEITGRNGHCGIATVVIKGHKLVNIIHNEKYLVGSNSVKKNLWGLDTLSFHQVRLICKSPNYWTDNVGNKHYFFMLEGCKSPEEVRAFHNENLTDDLLKHRKVMDVLGGVTKVESIDDQLSGIGFDETVRDDVVLRVTKHDGKKEIIKVNI